MKKLMLVAAVAFAMALTVGVYAADAKAGAAPVKKEVKDMNLDELKKLLAEKQAALKDAKADAKAALEKEIKAIEEAIKAKTPAAK